VRHLYTQLPAHERDERAYRLTPPACPGSGYWTFRLDFGYRDGVVQ